MISDKDLSSLLAEVECYESCVDQLKRELPKYFQTHIITNKESSSFVKTLRTVASLESNQNIQSTIFLFAQKTEYLDNQRKLYEQCLKSLISLLDVSKSKIINPMKDMINDMKSLRKKREILSQQEQKKPLTVSDYETYQSYVIHEKYMNQLYPIHHEIFEQHRICSMKKLLSMMLYTELRYHCQVIQEYTEVLNKLQEIEDYY